MRIAKIAALAAGLTAVAVGMASPASADLVEGTYSGTLTAGGPVGQNSTWVFASCGPDCLRETSSDRGEYHRQGNAWVANNDPEGDGIICVVNIDNGSTAGSITCPSYEPVLFQLTKTG